MAIGLLKEQLDLFLQYVAKVPDRYECTQYGPYLVSLRHKSVTVRAAKPFDLTFMALTHGNEVAGVAMVNHILKAITLGLCEPKLHLALIIGNPEAGLAGQRFLERDLNRSFHQNLVGESLEAKRAALIRPMLQQSQKLIDLHQTRLKGAQPFFIFPYAKDAVALAQRLCPAVPIITHWGESFSKEGMCTDEFVLSQGGTGITLETGQCGFDHLQVALGSMVLWESLALLSGGPVISEAPFNEAPLYTWSHVEAYPTHETPVLSDQLMNFQHIEKGQMLGKVLESGKEVIAARTGFMIFPQVDPPHPGKPRPKELYRLVQPLDPADLPM